MWFITPLLAFTLMASSSLYIFQDHHGLAVIMMMAITASANFWNRLFCSIILPATKQHVTGNREECWCPVLLPCGAVMPLDEFSIRLCSACGSGISKQVQRAMSSSSDLSFPARMDKEKTLPKFISEFDFGSSKEFCDECMVSAASF